MSDQVKPPRRNTAEDETPEDRAAEVPAEDEEEVPLCQDDTYDATLSLADREAKWGFSFSELQSAVKVVRVLFHNPALYVGDPYLSDSRLYTMITRDRKTKRENRDIFKAIMNGEKSRRKRYLRQQDIEAVRRTAMKRERDDALSALLLTGSEGANDNVAPLLLAERPKAPELNGSDQGEDSLKSGAAGTASAGDGSAAGNADTLSLSASEKEVLRLVGAFENLLRLEQALRGERVEGYEGDSATAGGTTARSAAAASSCVANPPVTGGEGDPSASSASFSRLKKLRTETDASAAVPAVELDWLVITQLTAQVYRYLPHPYGSQMPPPLFDGAGPADAVNSPLVMRSYVRGMKCYVAQRAAALVHLAKARAPPNTPNLPITSGGTESVPLRSLLASTLRDVIVRTPLVELQSIHGLRSLIENDDPSAASSQMMAAVDLPLDDLLRALELVLLEGASDERFCPVPATTDGDWEQDEGRARAQQQLCVAEQTLHCFIARRVYGSAKVRGCGPSPVLIQHRPPTSSSEEPEGYCIYDDVQRYAVEHHEDDAQLKLNKFIGCHICKVRYNRLHPYYYSMCHLCGEYNYNKRLMARDLRGKTVLLTGCRIKIGYAMALSLLRCGATVLGTTRFIHEAVARFQQEIDYDVWKDRLHLFSLDLRDMWVVTQFCAFVRQRYKKLFAIINNAAQTIARTPQYTEHLRNIELNPPATLQASIQDDECAAEWHNFFRHHTTVTVGQPLSIEYHPSMQPFLDTSQAACHDDASEEIHSKSAVALHVTGDRTLIFDRYDTQAEESDHREKNSWVMNLAEIQGSEAAEVMAINALSPFILNGRLKVCLTDREGDAVPGEPRFIINVSAMEGQFYRFKQTTHPHTNMAKAALNMMTRTSADDYAAEGIYMNSVDTGWITDESPKLKKDRRAEQFMLCPLDEVDAAARCLDLIFTNSRVYGMFYKDFKVIAW
ncbi:oxidoreductase-like protein [Leishmania mexicana MHOM/GT/2001/U1103]|uniref:Oxidoreductase-like protein n=1 Tax=Leishmania mexicana (strain MHOM/GT/2001/U1103) TaxID=929439 RepID=E9AZR0_LEIMU|nr:oxidoreductase-like protein [Leishmania mexicana MHOM/GT/2001/U1103]CBZ28461.1 oxidoreductase-like protein [Leishmania mexicana MHOM/GT/2001/U1103]